MPPSRLLGLTSACVTSKQLIFLSTRVHLGAFMQTRARAADLRDQLGYENRQ
jgi:hypothetical protein